MDKYLFSYATASDPPLKRGVIRLVEKATGQPKLKRMYLDNQRFPRPNENFFQAAVRKLALDVRYDVDALTAIPQTGPVVVVANHPYGVLDGIVISWLISKVRTDFVVLTNAVLMRAPEVNGFILPVDFSETEEAQKTNIASRAAARAQLEKGGVVVVFPAGAVSTAPDKLGLQAGGRLALAAVRRPAYPAVEGDRRAGLVLGAEQPAVPDRQPRQLHLAHLADLPRGAVADRHCLAGRDRRADPVCRTGRDQGPSGARRSLARPRLRARRGWPPRRAKRLNPAERLLESRAGRRHGRRESRRKRGGRPVLPSPQRMRMWPRSPLGVLAADRRTSPSSVRCSLIMLSASLATLVSSRSSGARK